MLSGVRMTYTDYAPGIGLSPVQSSNIIKYHSPIGETDTKTFVRNYILRYVRDNPGSRVVYMAPKRNLNITIPEYQDQDMERHTFHELTIADQLKKRVIGHKNGSTIYFRSAIIRGYRSNVILIEGDIPMTDDWHFLYGNMSKRGVVFIIGEGLSGSVLDYYWDKYKSIFNQIEL